MFDERLVRLAQMQHEEYMAEAARERQASAALRARRSSLSQARQGNRWRGRLGNWLIATGCRLLATASLADTSLHTVSMIKVNRRRARLVSVPRGHRRSSRSTQPLSSTSRR